VQIPAARAQIENRVTNQLTGSVIGRLAAPVGFKDRMRELVNNAQARLVRKTADGVDGFVLEQEHALFTVLPAIIEPYFLKAKSSLVLDPSQPLNFHKSRSVKTY
jgi:hypothetical protein